MRSAVRTLLGMTLLAGLAATGFARAEDAPRPAMCRPIF